MDTKIVTLCVFFSLFTLTVCITPKYKTCSTEFEGVVTNIDVNTTEDAERAIELVRGTTIEVSFKFTFKKGSASAVTAVVHGIVGGLPVSFKIPHPDVCSCATCGLQCPLKANTNYIYTEVIAVDKAYPKIRLVVKWELKDQKGREIWCVEMPAVIIDRN